MKFELIKKRKLNPKCPDCLGGRLYYDKKSKTWVCCKNGGGWMWCGREYNGRQDAKLGQEVVE